METDKDTAFCRQRSPSVERSILSHERCDHVAPDFQHRTMKVAQSSRRGSRFGDSRREEPVDRRTRLSQSPLLLGYNATAKPKPTADILLATERGSRCSQSGDAWVSRAAAFTSDAKSRWSPRNGSVAGYRTRGKFWAQAQLRGVDAQ
jgi:hypothetical protein